MKSVMLAAQTLQLSDGDFAMIAGGMECMSNIPHYMMKSRTGQSLGNMTLTDGLVHDGLWGKCRLRSITFIGFFEPTTFLNVWS